MEIQQLLLSHDYLQRAAGVTVSNHGRLPTDTAAERPRSSSGLTVDCHRSALHDVLLLRQRQHQHPQSMSAMMQYPASQHPLPAAAAAAIGLGPPATSPYCSPYYQRPSSSSHHYQILSPTHGFPDSSRHGMHDAFSTTIQPSFSYQQQAAILRDTATRLTAGDSVQPSMTDMTGPVGNERTSRLTAQLTSYCTDRRCGPSHLYDCLPVAGPLSLSSSRYYMPGGPHCQSDSSTTSQTSAGNGRGAFIRYLRPPVKTDSYITGDCVCQWIEPSDITSTAKFKHEVS